MIRRLLRAVLVEIRRDRRPPPRTGEDAWVRGFADAMGLRESDVAATYEQMKAEGDGAMVEMVERHGILIRVGPTAPVN